MNFAFSEISIILLLLLGGQTAVPLGMPPGPEDPTMFQMAPENCLFYTTWANTVAPDPAGNITERWLAQPELVDSYRKLFTAIRKVNNSGSDVDEAENFILSLVERCLQNACSIYVRSFDPNAFPRGLEAGAVLTLGDDATDMESQLLAILNQQMGDAAPPVKTRKIGEWTIRELQFDGIVLHWGVVNSKYLAFAVGEGEMEKLLTNLRSPSPGWLDDLKSEIPVNRVSAVTAINVQKLLQSIRESVSDQPRSADDFETFLDFTGLEKGTLVGWVSGLDDKGFLCRGILRSDGALDGIFEALSQTPLQIDQLAKISNDPTLLTAGAISFPKLMDLLTSFEILPDLEVISAELDLDLKRDVIEVLDEHAYVYGSVNVTNPTAGWIVGIGASNEMELTDSHARILEKIREVNEDTSNRLESSEFNGHTIYSLIDEDAGFMGSPPLYWTLADGELLISLDQSSLRRHLRRKPSSKKSLTANQWITESAFAAPRMDAEGPLLITSVDLASLIKIGIPLITVMGEEIFPLGFDYTVGDLPPVDVLTKDMKPNVSALFRTPNGLEFVTRQTYPGSTPGSSWGLLFMGIFSISRAEMGSAEMPLIEDGEHVHEDGEHVHEDGEHAHEEPQFTHRSFRIAHHLNACGCPTS